MQLRSTTPLTYSIFRWLAMTLLPTAIIVLAFVQTTNAEQGSDQQSRIDELTQEIDKRVASTRKLNTQSDSLSSQLTALKNERSYLERQMAQNADDMRSLEQTVANLEKDVEVKQSALGTIMAEMYVNGDISPVEMLASSQTVGDFLDAQTQRESINQQLMSSIQKVKSAKESLAVQKDKLTRIAGNQKNQQIALAAKQSEQQSALAVVNGQSSKLQAVTKEMAEERKRLQNEQQASIVSLMAGAEQVSAGTISEPIKEAPKSESPTPSKPAASQPKSQKAAPTTSSPTSSSTPSKTSSSTPAAVVLPNGGYPSYLQNCYVDSNALSYGIDPWGYGCRQCVSYTAWKVLQKTGRPAMYWGNANQWPASARRVGYKTGSSPRAQSVAVMTTGPYGHVAWVESINPNGTLNVSQYNYWLRGKSNGGWGWYSEFRNVSPQTYQVYIYV